MDSGRRVVVAAVVLLAVDVIAGVEGVSSGVNTWGEVWGFNTMSAVPLPVVAVELALAWLAARNVRPPVGKVSAVLLGAICLISVLFGLFDGDITNDALSARSVACGVALLLATAALGLLAVAHARQLSRPSASG
jgi:hypothetical protein